MSELTKEEMESIAKKLVKESIKVGKNKKGKYECVNILYNLTDSSCQEFAFEVEKECWKQGAHTLIQPYSSIRERNVYTLKPKNALKEMSPISLALAKIIDVSIFIGEQDDPNWAKDISSRLRLIAPIKQKIRGILDKRKVRWVYFGWPLPSTAKAYGCSVEKFRRVFFNSIRYSFSNETRKFCRYYYNMLKGKSLVEILADDGTNLKFKIKGRPVLVDDGIISKEDIKRGDFGLNVPSGEVFIAPLETTANGKIIFEKVMIPGFGEVKGLLLEFKNGKISKFEAEENRKSFIDFLNANTGDKDRIAELGIGCNPGAEFIGSIIVDEKIFGTIHIAIGNNTGAYHGVNKASSHLDMIKDMKNGKLIVDGKTIMEMGKPLKWDLD
ncbi:MAG: aminopeptidase [Candidatus Bathyarchaeia archaeon]